MTIITLLTIDYNITLKLYYIPYSARAAKALKVYIVLHRDVDYRNTS